MKPPGSNQNFSTRRTLLACAVLALGALIPHTTEAAPRALLVGVEHYQQRQISKLPGVGQDLELMKSALVKTGEFKPDQLKLLLDAQSNKKSVVQAFQEWLIKGSGPGDTVLFYFSGHGTQVWDENGDERGDGKDEALIMWDARIRPRITPRDGYRGRAFPASAIRNCLLDDEIHTLLTRLKGRRVIFISDSCHSGSVYKHADPFFVRNKTIEQPGLPKSVFESRTSPPLIETVDKSETNIGNDLDAPGIELVAFTASQDSQLAQVVRFNVEPKGSHSVFTWFLYHALTGKADGDGNGLVTFEELAGFLEREISAQGFRQRPQAAFIPNSLASAALGSGPSVSTQRERIDALHCLFEAKGVDGQSTATLRNRLKERVPVITWTDRKDGVSCRIRVEKVGQRYGAQVSDITGSLWEPVSGRTIDHVVEPLAGNLRAVFIQRNLAALHNPAARVTLDVSHHAGSGGTGEPSPAVLIKGDTIKFAARLGSSGHLFLAAVDSMGVVHPLFPGRKGCAQKLQAGRTIVLGADGSFRVGPPFGKETIFAVYLDDCPDALARLWLQNSIGTIASPSFAPQLTLLDQLWKLARSMNQGSRPWTCRSYTVESFER
jgi:hypothetical protein